MSSFTSTTTTLLCFAALAALFVSEAQAQTTTPAGRRRRAMSCEVLVTSDTGSGMINSLDETKEISSGNVDCDWVIIGKPGSTLKLKFLNNNQEQEATEEETSAVNNAIQTRKGAITPTNLACDDCETECCNSVEIIEGGVSTRYCCADLPAELPTSSNAVIVRLHRDFLSKQTKGFLLNWSE